MSRLIPRTIRGQLILGTALLQCLLVAAVFGYVYHHERDSLRSRIAERLAYQSHVLTSVSAAELKDGRLASLQAILDGIVIMPSIRAVRITDLTGRTLAYSDQSGRTTYPPLSAEERRQVGLSYGDRIFDNGKDGLTAVEDIDVDNAPVALAWIYPDISQDQIDLSSLLRSALIFALLAIAANALFSMVLARSVTRPLRGLLRGTKLLIRDPERSDVFPLKTRSLNEAGELTRSFNTMVAALKEQRAGLNETLALLDSMLANAPIGFAFFDRKTRYVRMNQFLAEMDHLSISNHLGRTVEEIFPGSIGATLAGAIDGVFTTGVPERDLEIHGELPTMPGAQRVWLTSLYPVRTGGDDRPGEPREGTRQGGTGSEPKPLTVRWVGAVIVDVTDRKLSEELLRRTEKLAATGQLAASIAHEINNPLEAVTNLLYLLHQQPLDLESRHYADMAQQEIARVSQITQQTLRFYRQSSNPALTNPAELLDSVLGLHQGRFNATNVKIIRRYRDAAEILALSGEIRQLFANLVGNALDAMPKGGRLILSVHLSRAWDKPDSPGVRITVADTGCGMTAAVRQRIFEPFFTTKEVTGTGLGLWISSEIIAKHQATVRVRSRPAGDDGGSGTVFMLFFPFDGLSEQPGMEQRKRSFALAEEKL